MNLLSRLFLHVFLFACACVPHGVLHGLQKSNDVMACGYCAQISCMSLCPGFAKCHEAKGKLVLIKADHSNEVWGGYESQVWFQNILSLELPERLTGSLSRWDDHRKDFHILCGPESTKFPISNGLYLFDIEYISYYKIMAVIFNSYLSVTFFTTSKWQDSLVSSHYY